LASAKEIPPGGEGKIDVTFKTGSGRGGKLEKTITVTTNDPAQQTVSLKVSTEVKVVLAAEPNRLSFGQIKKGGEAVRYAALTGSYKESVKITSVESNNQYLKVDTNLKGFENDKQKQIRVSLRPGMKIGRFNERVILHTDHKAVKDLTLYVMGEIVGNIVVTPNFLHFGMFEHGKSVERLITVRATADNTFKVLEIKSTVPEVVTGLETVQPGKEYRIRATLKENFTGDILRGQLLIKTNDKDQGMIEVNVFGRVARKPQQTDSPQTP